MGVDVYRKMQIKRSAGVVFLLGFIIICLGFYYDDLYNTFSSYPEFDNTKRIELDESKEEKLDEKKLTEKRFAPERFQHRLDHLHKACKIGYDVGAWDQNEMVRYSSKWLPGDNFAVSPDNNFLFCVVPKCGSNTWHRVAYHLNQPDTKIAYSNRVRNKNNQMALDLDEKRGECLIRDAKVFRGIAVKHPFRRLISAWNQKLRRNDELYQLYLLEAYPKIRFYLSTSDPDHVVTFPDMMKYIARYGDDVENLDYHFLSVEYLCKPCLYPYNAIVKMESMDRDEEYLTGRLHLDKMPTDGKGVQYTGGSDDPAEIIRSYFKDVDRITISRLMDLYHYDFVLSGYTFDIETLTAGGFYS